MGEARTLELSSGTERESAGQLTPGASLGRYVIESLIGSGGMGEVYAATDPKLERRVAIKVLSRRSEDPRLLREAQAMARISHPNVLPVYDVGLVDGRLFLALEYVQGQTLAQWMRAETRPWTEVLDRFVAAGRGLAAAHAQGIVHRDFKPANVMLGPGPHTRVMDFGVARTSGGGGTDSGRHSDTGDSGGHSGEVSAELTSEGMIVGTPAYMAPEQLIGATVDHRADQFSFCTALYEGLYGRRPFSGIPGGRRAQAILAGRVAAPPLGSGVPRSVHATILRGLAPYPEERWASMDELLRRLSRRRRRKLRLGATAAGGVVAIGLVTAATLAPARSTGVCHELDGPIAGVWNDGARSELAEAFAVPGVRYGGAAAQQVTATLDEYAERWVAERRDACAATRIDGEQPEGLLDLRMACLDQRLGELEGALQTLGEADATIVEGAAAAVRSLPSPSICADVERLGKVEPPDAAIAQAVEEIRVKLGREFGAGKAGRPGPALEASRPLMAEAEALGYAPLLAQTREQVGWLEMETAEYEAAVEHLEAAALLSEELGLDRTAGRAQSLLLWTLGGRLARFEEAERWGQAALATLERQGGQEEERAQLYGRMFHVAYRRGDLEAAKGRLQQAIDLYEEYARDSVYYPGMLANLGAIAIAERDYDGALAHFERGLEGAVAVFGPDHPEVGRLHANIGSALHFAERDDEATKHYADALAVFEGAYGEEHPFVGRLLGNAATVERAQGRPAEAVAMADRAIAIMTPTLGAEHPEVGGALLNKGSALLDLGRQTEARDTYRRALEVVDASLPDPHPHKVEVLWSLGQLELDLDHPTIAAPLLQRALDMMKTLEDDEARITAVTEALTRARTKTRNNG